MFRLPSHPVNGETIVSRYKSWQHLTLWTIVSLRMRDTPLSAKEDAGEKGDGSGPGDRERDMAALIAPFPPRDGIGGGVTGPADTHTVRVWLPIGGRQFELESQSAINANKKMKGPIFFFCIKNKYGQAWKQCGGSG